MRMMTPPEETVSYTTRLKPAICAFVFFGICTAIIAHMAMNNKQGMVIQHIITLGSGGATIVLLILTVVSALFTLLGVLLIWDYFFSDKKSLKITADAVTVPKSIMRPEKTVRFADVAALRQRNINSVLFLEMITADGKTHSIANVSFASKDEYHRICQLIEQRCVAAQA